MIFLFGFVFCHTLTPAQMKLYPKHILTIASGTLLIHCKNKCKHCKNHSINLKLLYKCNVVLIDVKYFLIKNIVDSIWD